MPSIEIPRGVHAPLFCANAVPALLPRLMPGAHGSSMSFTWPPPNELSAQLQKRTAALPRACIVSVWRRAAVSRVAPR